MLTQNRSASDPEVESRSKSLMSAQSTGRQQPPSILNKISEDEASNNPFFQPYLKESQDNTTLQSGGKPNQSAGQRSQSYNSSGDSNVNANLGQSLNAVNSQTQDLNDVVSSMQ